MHPVAPKPIIMQYFLIIFSFGWVYILFLSVRRLSDSKNLVSSWCQETSRVLERRAFAYLRRILIIHLTALTKTLTSDILWPIMMSTGRFLRLTIDEFSSHDWTRIDCKVVVISQLYTPNDLKQYIMALFRFISPLIKRRNSAHITFKIVHI